nr:hypothetical protein [uncultured Deefgea sp.]
MQYIQVKSIPYQLGAEVRVLHFSDDGIWLTMGYSTFWQLKIEQIASISIEKTRQRLFGLIPSYSWLLIKTKNNDSYSEPLHDYPAKEIRVFVAYIHSQIETVF